MKSREGIPYTSDERAAVLKEVNGFLDDGHGIVVISAGKDAPPAVVTTLNNAALKKLYTYLLLELMMGAPNIVETQLTNEDGTLAKGD